MKINTVFSRGHLVFKWHLFFRCERNTFLCHFVPFNNAKRGIYLHSAVCYKRKFWVIRGRRDQKMTSLKRKLLMLAHSSQWLWPWWGWRGWQWRAWQGKLGGDPNYVSLLLCTSTLLGETWLAWGELNFTYFLLKNTYLQNLNYFLLKTHICKTLHTSFFTVK